MVNIQTSTPQGVFVLKMGRIKTPLCSSRSEILNVVFYVVPLSPVASFVWIRRDRILSNSQQVRKMGGQVNLYHATSSQLQALLITYSTVGSY